MINIKNPVQHIQYNEKITICIFIIIVLLGAWLRFSDIGYQSLWIDESFSALAAEKLSQTEEPLLDSGRLYSRSKPHIYLTSFIYTITGRNLSALRMPSAFFGTAMIILVFCFSRQLYRFSPLPALIAAFLLSTSYLEVAWSRQIRMYIEFQFFYILTILLYYRYITMLRPSYLLIIAAFLSTTVTIMLHISGPLILIPLVVLLAIYFKDIDSFKKNISVSIAVFIISIYLIMYRHSDKWIQIVTEKNIPLFDINKLIIRLDHYITFLVTSNTLIFILSFIMIFFSIIKLEKQSIFLVVVFIFSLFLIITQDVLIMRGIFFILPILIILAARCIHIISHQITTLLYKIKYSQKQSIPGQQSWLSSSITISILLSLTLTSSVLAKHHVFTPQKNYFLEYDAYFNTLNTWDYTPQPDFNSAYEYIQQHRQKNDIFLVAHTAIHHWYMPNTKAYWLGFLFLDRPNRNTFYLDDQREGKTEGYLGMPIVSTISDLQDKLSNHHGFVIIDYFAMSTDVPEPFVQYLLEKAPIQFTNELGVNMPWNRVWVGRF